MDGKLKVKSELDGDIRRFSAEMTGIESLKKTVAEIYKMDVGTFALKYLDDEGDLVLMDDDRELEEAVSLCNLTETKLLKLVVNKSPVKIPTEGAKTSVAGPSGVSKEGAGEKGVEGSSSTAPKQPHSPVHMPPHHGPAHEGAIPPPPGPPHDAIPPPPVPPHDAIPPPPVPPHDAIPPPHGPPHDHGPHHRGGPPHHGPPHAPPYMPTPPFENVFGDCGATPGSTERRREAEDSTLEDVLNSFADAFNDESGRESEEEEYNPFSFGRSGGSGMGQEWGYNNNPNPFGAGGLNFGQTNNRAQTAGGGFGGGFPFGNFGSMGGSGNPMGNMGNFGSMGGSSGNPMGNMGNFGSMGGSSGNPMGNMMGLGSMLGGFGNLSQEIRQTLMRTASELQRSGQLPALFMSLPSILPALATAAVQAGARNPSAVPTDAQAEEFSRAVTNSVNQVVSGEVASSLGNVAASALRERPFRDILATVLSQMPEAGIPETPENNDMNRVPESPLRRGDEGEGVEMLHRCLANLGYLNVDTLGSVELRKFGSHTEEALLAFQADFGLANVEDGVYDGPTRSSMVSLYEVAAA